MYEVWFIKDDKLVIRIVENDGELGQLIVTMSRDGYDLDEIQRRDND